MNITLSNVSERTLRTLYDALLPEYEAAEQAFEDASIAAAAAEARFDNVKFAMRSIKEALHPLVTVIVPSKTFRGVEYTVTLDRANGNKVTCSCPSFRFERGLTNGTCKHIREAINQRGLLNSLV
jgi:SWIM zinc finger